MLEESFSKHKDDEILSDLSFILNVEEAYFLID
jgi:hypothetical protein